jgi:hypothetical protein
MTTDRQTGARLDGDTVPVLRGDVRAIIAILVEYVDCPEVWTDTIARLRAAAEGTATSTPDCDCDQSGSSDVRVHAQDCDWRRAQERRTG